MRGLVRAAACGMVGAVLVLGACPARAQDDEDNKSFDQKIIGNVLGTLGLRSTDDIDYRERSPLVIPPKVELPPPQANATAAAPNWPVDPDVKRRKEESSRRFNEVEDTRPLRPNELNVGDRKRNTGPAESQDQIDGRPSRPSDLGYKGGVLGSIFAKDQDTAKFTSEPPRTSLIDPPVGYQTPSPDQPYGAKSESLMPKIPSFFDFGTATK
jgi:hypothetical protein